MIYSNPIINANKSQAFQDEFALRANGGNTSYIEIGAAHPDINSNTYQLEVIHGWRGFSIEFNSSAYKTIWDNCKERKNKIYWQDALLTDYNAAITENNLSSNIGYLSMDIDPASQTFLAMQQVIESNIKFNCITFEHDLYCSDTDYNIIGTEYLLKNGYKIAVTDVYDREPYIHIETWFVAEHVDFPRMTFDEFIRSIS
jgi:hypothetical protein